MKRLLLFVLLTVALFSLEAYSIMDGNNGNRIFGGDASLLAMGSAGVSKVNTLGAVWLNPALATTMQRGLTLQLNTNWVLDNEDRSIPMYNFFDGYIDDANYASNTNSYNQLQGRLNYLLSMDQLKLAFNLGWQPLQDFQSNYEEQVRNDGNSDSGNSGDNSPDGYPPIIANNYLNTAGELGGITAGLSFCWQDKLDLGISVQQLQGDWEMERRINWTEAANELVEEELPEYNLYLEGDFEDSYRLGVGIHYQVSERIGLGFAMHPKNELERDISGVLDTLALEEIYWQTQEVNGLMEELTWQDKYESELGELILPSDYRLGVEYHPRNLWETYLSLDIQYIKYSQVDDKYSDIINYYLGVEHKVNQKLPLRFGFNYKTSYYLFYDGDREFAQKVTMPGFSAGTGFTVYKNLGMDLGLEYSLRKYDQVDLFGDSYYDQEGLWNEMEPVDRDWDNPDQVDESLFTVQASLTWHWQVNNNAK